MRVPALPNEAGGADGDHQVRADHDGERGRQGGFGRNVIVLPGFRHHVRGIGHGDDEVLAGAAERDGHGGGARVRPARAELQHRATADGDVAGVVDGIGRQVESEWCWRRRSCPIWFLVVTFIGKVPPAAATAGRGPRHGRDDQVRPTVNDLNRSLLVLRFDSGIWSLASSLAMMETVPSMVAGRRHRRGEVFGLARGQRLEWQVAKRVSVALSVASGDR